MADPKSRTPTNTKVSYPPGHAGVFGGLPNMPVKADPKSRPTRSTNANPPDGQGGLYGGKGPAGGGADPKSQAYSRKPTPA